MTTRLDGDRGEGNVDAADLVAEPRAPSALEALLELRVVQARAEHGKRMDSDLLLAEALRELVRALAPVDRLVRPHGARAVPREVGVGPRELAARRQGREQLDGIPGAALRLHGSSGTPQEVGEPAQRFAFLELVAEGTAMLERLLERRDPLVVLIGQVAAAGLPLEQLGELPSRKPLAETQGAGVLRSCLAVGAERRGALRRSGGVAKDRLHVAGGLRVVCEPGEVACAVRRFSEGRERSAVELGSPGRSERLLDGYSGELVAEGDAALTGHEHARHETFVQMLEALLAERLQEPELGLRRYDGDGLEQSGGRRGETGCAGEHRVADRGRDPVSLRREGLRDEERVSGSLAIEILDVDVVGLRERRHGDGRKRLEPEAEDSLPGGELADQDPQRVHALELVVSIGHEDEARRVLDPASQQPDDVERRLVRPVCVLEHEDRRPRAKLTQQLRRDLVRTGSARNERSELATGHVRDIEEWPQRTRREECLARPREHTDRRGLLGAEPLHERRLADPGLSSEQDETAAARVRLRAGSGERRQCLFAFEKPASGQRVDNRRHSHRTLVAERTFLSRTTPSWCGEDDRSPSRIVPEQGRSEAWPPHS
jgi:hypothetical protein